MNLLNVPNEDVYRRCFIADEGFELIGADYSSQEVVITATLAKERLWLDCVRRGDDLHSLNASMSQPGLWKENELDDCVYKLHKQKCKCPKHIEMRTASKVVVFSSLYGGTPIKIAQILHISREEATEIQNGLFEALPNIKSMMEKFAGFALNYGRIMEPVLGRSRFFHKWKLNNYSMRGGVERQSYNYPVQASGSALLKIASVLIRRWIRNEGLTKDVQILLFVHDEILLQSRPKYTTLVRQKVEHYMKLAAKLGGFNIDAQALSGKNWAEIH